MKKLYIFILLLFSCEMFAQEDYNALLQRQTMQMGRLYQEIEQKKHLIASSKERLYNLKLNWYNTCVNYLKKGKENFKAHELDKLLKETKKEIDGEDLYNEIARAKACYEKGDPYTYQNVPPPSKDTVQHDNDNVDKNKKKKNDTKENPSKKKPVKKDPEKKDNKDKKDKKDKKDDNPSIEESPSPATPVINPEVRENPIIETDPNKVKPGEEKTVVETPVKEDNPVLETPIKGDNPIVNPEVHKKEDSSSKKKTPEKDKGEIEEYMSKELKNKDGSK